MANDQQEAVAADYQRFKDLTFDDFRDLASSAGLSRYQRIGFPDSYRQGYEELIFRDICGKLPALAGEGRVVVDVGPGCSELPHMLIDLCRRRRHTLVLCDSAEMLAHLPDEPFIHKVSGRYPSEVRDPLAPYCRRVDAFLSYSVLHYVFAHQPLFDFVDHALGLLADGGQMLLGDIPNVSKRKRFFSSATGVRFHREFTGTADTPDVRFNVPEPERIDDAIVLAILARCRAAGYDAYVLPQAPELPMANRREDLLVHCP